MSAVTAAQVAAGQVVTWGGLRCTVRAVSSTGRRLKLEWWGVSLLDFNKLRSAWVDARTVTK